jgi:hypothetical protein
MIEEGQFAAGRTDTLELTRMIEAPRVVNTAR